MSKRNIFHIGFFHSGSKFLQSEIFPNIPNYNFLIIIKEILSNLSAISQNFDIFFTMNTKILKD